MNELTLDILLETPPDGPAIEKLHERAFGPGRFAKSAYRLREGVAPVAELSFVARVGTLLVGSVRLTPARLAGNAVLLLGPLAVEPAFANRGIGLSLLQRSLAAAAARGDRLVFLVGDEPYYARAGFKAIAPGRVSLPGPVDPRRILVRELVPDAFAGLSGELDQDRAVPVAMGT
jgi:predicted N-acetyltransferase YhbS